MKLWVDIKIGVLLNLVFSLPKETQIVNAHIYGHKFLLILLLQTIERPDFSTAKTIPVF